MIKPLLATGDPLLTTKSQLVQQHEFNTPELNELIIDLADTQEFNNGVGISAIQIGITKRIATIKYDPSNPRYKTEIGVCPLTVVINPEIEIIDDEISIRNEGCLSVIGIRGDVPRYKKLKLKFYDQYGNYHTEIRDDFFVRVFQHELDHMNGILFPMRINGNDNK